MKTNLENNKKRTKKIQIPRSSVPDHLRGSVGLTVSVSLRPRRTWELGGGEGRSHGEGSFEFVICRVLMGGGGGSGGGGGGGDENLRH